MSLLRVIVLGLVIGCRARLLDADQRPLQLPEPDIRPSSEPFTENPRFCGAIGNACRVLPMPC